MIKTATRSDLAQIIEAWRAAGARFHPETAERDLASVIGQDLALVDERGGEIAGTGLGRYDGRRGWVHRLATRPERRGRGTASGLLSAPATDPWRDLQPDLRADPYVFATGEPPPGLFPFALIREDEGLTLVLTRADADRAGLAYDYVAARITLRLNSALEGVGLTALVTRILADAGISCNVIAGRVHDHLFVDWAQRAQALALLKCL